MSPSRIAHAFAAAALCCCASAHAAEPWTQNMILKTPTQAGYAVDEGIGFGRTVELSADWLAVGVAFGYCTTPAGVIGGGSVLMYRFDESTREFNYAQQICGAGPGTSMAIWDDWLLLGSPHSDDTPGDQMQNGKVSFLKFDPQLQKWALVQTALGGAVDSLMGYSVAMQDGVAAAGESGYNDDRGRVQTWRLNAAGTQWSSEGWVTPNSIPFLRVNPGEGFGAYLALDITGCRAPSCTNPLDAMIVQSKSGLHSIERLANGWGTRKLVGPARGTVTSFSPVALNRSVAISTALVSDDLPDAPCPKVGNSYYTSVVRVLERRPASIELQSAGIACIDQLRVSPMRGSVRDVALSSSRGTEFHVGIPDYPAENIGTVSSWDLVGANNTVMPTDFVADPNLTADYSAQYPGTLYHPSFTGDMFGISIAVRSRWMAVGAPIYNALIPTLGAGYVAIYER